MHPLTPLNLIEWITSIYIFSLLGRWLFAFTLVLVAVLIYVLALLLLLFLFFFELTFVFVFFFLVLGHSNLLVLLLVLESLEDRGIESETLMKVKMFSWPKVA